MTETQGCGGRVPVTEGFQAARVFYNLISAASHKSWTNDLYSSLPAWAVPRFYDSVQTGRGSCSHVHPHSCEEGSRQPCHLPADLQARQCRLPRQVCSTPSSQGARQGRCWLPPPDTAPHRPPEPAPASRSGPRASCGW